MEWVQDRVKNTCKVSKFCIWCDLVQVPGVKWHLFEFQLRKEVTAIIWKKKNKSRNRIREFCGECCKMSGENNDIERRKAKEEEAEANGGKVRMKNNTRNVRETWLLSAKVQNAWNRRLSNLKDLWNLLESYYHLIYLLCTNAANNKQFEKLHKNLCTFAAKRHSATHW